MTVLTFEELMNKIPTMSLEELDELSYDLKEFKSKMPRKDKGVPRKSMYRAVIQTNLHTGVHRVLFKKSINGEVKILEKTKPNGCYKVTGYKCLGQAYKRLKGAIPVYMDEQIEWNGQNCELTLFETGEEEVA